MILLVNATFSFSLVHSQEWYADCHVIIAFNYILGLLVCDFEKDTVDVKLATLDKVVSMNDLMDLTGITSDAGEESNNNVFTDSIYPDL